MPLYEYQCDACGHRFEHIQKFSDALVDTCPVCGGAVHKLQSAPAIQFKGSGFYITDYAKKEYASAAKADSGSEDAKDKTDKSEKTDKSDKTDKTEKVEKAEKSTKTETSSSTSDAKATSTSSRPAASSTPAKNS